MDRNLPLPLWRSLVILIGGGCVLWIALGVTFNLTLASYLPGAARALWPVGVTAKVVEARQSLLAIPRASVADIAASRSSLRAAALREPLNTDVLGTLAGLDEYQGDKDQARRLFGLSEAVSRRNALTQMWLLEDAVSRGDIAGAVSHYDRAMRVSVDLRPALLPVLATAAENPEIGRVLSKTLAGRPLWWKDYLQLLGKSGTNASVMSAALQATHPNPHDAEERVLAEQVLRRMIALKDERGAVVVANRLQGHGGARRTLVGGTFESQDGLLPFAWWFQDEANIRAYRDVVPTGGLGLHVTTTDDTSGGAAQQLVGLAGGRYVIKGMVGGVSAQAGNRPMITVNCLDGKLIGRFELPLSSDRTNRFAFPLNVPEAGCVTQWINIVAAPIGDTDIWLDNLVIQQGNGLRS